jgi:hypothetical protein
LRQKSVVSVTDLQQGTPRLWRALGVQVQAVLEDLGMRGVLLWLIGIPIPIIILLYLFNVI